MLRSLGLFAASTLVAGLAIFHSVSNASASGAVTFFVVLNGASECNSATPPLCHQGDLDAYGAATILLVPGATPTVCFGIVTHNLAENITAAHIHAGGTGTNGVIRVTLSPSGAAAPGNPRGWGGCSSGADVSAAEINAIKANPQNFYVNVHTGGVGGFPGGAIRGQLF
jgi:hypothetical protein